MTSVSTLDQLWHQHFSTYYQWYAQQLLNNNGDNDDDDYDDDDDEKHLMHLKEKSDYFWIGVN